MTANKISCGKSKTGFFLHALNSLSRHLTFTQKKSHTDKTDNSICIHVYSNIYIYVAGQNEIQVKMILT